MVRVNRPAQRSVADPEGAVLYLQVTRTARATTSSPASASTARSGPARTFIRRPGIGDAYGRDPVAVKSGG